MDVNWFLILRQNLLLLQKFAEGFIVCQDPFLFGFADYFFGLIHQRHPHLNFYFAFFTLLSIS